MSPVLYVSNLTSGSGHTHLNYYEERSMFEESIAEICQISCEIYALERNSRYRVKSTVTITELILNSKVFFGNGFIEFKSVMDR